jgi:hypothetical protein
VITLLGKTGSYPSVTWNGANYLVVWTNFSGVWYDEGDIYGARVSPQGDVIDTSGITIRQTNSDTEEFPSVGWNGSNFTVAWRSVNQSSILGAQVTPGGEVLDSDSIDLGCWVESYNQKRPAIASNGANTLVAWEHQVNAGNWSVCGRQLDSEGNIISPKQKISIGSNTQANGSAAWNGDNFLVVWQDWREGQYGDVYGMRIDTTGGAIDSVVFVISRHPERSENPEIVWNGESYLVVWQDRRDSVDWDIYCTPVSSEGVVFDTNGLAIATVTGYPGNALDEKYPALDWGGESYLVVWLFDGRGTHPLQIRGRRVSATGDLLGSEVELSTDGYLTPYCEAPQITWGDTSYLAVFAARRFDSAPFSIWGCLVDAELSEVDKFLICGDELSLGNVNHSDPVVTRGAGQFLVVWKDDRNGDYDLYAARVNEQGAVLDPDGFPVIVGDENPELLSVAYNGTNFVVAWLDGEDAHCARVTPEGTVIDPQGIRIFTNTDWEENGLHVLSGPPSVSLALASKYIWDEPYSSPRLCGAFFRDDTTTNYPPQPFSLLSPADDETVVRPALLGWEESVDPNPEDFIYYDLYVSRSPVFAPDSTVVADSLSVTKFLVSQLDYSVPYYWKVIAYDLQYSTWSEEVWSFYVENYGDANGDGAVGVTDIVFLINYLFKNGPPPNPLASGDENGDCEVNPADVIYLLNYLFRGGPPPREGCA